MIYDNDALIVKLEEHLRISGRSPNTINTYTHAVSLLCRYVGKQSADLTFDDAKNFIFHLHTNSNISKNTINCYHSCIAAFYEIFLDIHLSKKKIPFFTIKAHEVKIFSDDQLNALLSVAKVDSKRFAMYTLAYTCALRISEICNLKVEDIDTVHMTVHIAPSKNGKERTLALHPDALQALRLYSRTYHLKKDYYLFTYKKGKRPLTETVRYHFKSDLQLAGIPSNFTFHTFRHTMATNLLVNGLDPFSLMNFLGHSSFGSTSRYIHLAQAKKKSYVSIMNSVLGGLHHV